MAPSGGCSEHLVSAAQQLALLALHREEGNLTSAAKEVLVALGLEVSVTTLPPVNLAITTQPRKETKNEYGALMYIICVMVLFAAPMIALIVRYLWGERESSRMEAFYSRMMENKPPRMILYDYNGRRLTKPELQRRNPGRKLTYHGIPYQEGYYNPSSYCYRTTPLPTDDSGAIRASCAGGKPPTIYLSEHKWRRWLGYLSLAGTPDSPDSKCSFSQAVSPCSPDTYLTPSPPHSEPTFSAPVPLKPIAPWQNRSGSDTLDTQPPLRLLSRVKNFRRETPTKCMLEQEQKVSRNPEETCEVEVECNQEQSTGPHRCATLNFDETERETTHNHGVPQRKRAIIPGAAYRQLQKPNRLLESNVDTCHSSFPDCCSERHNSCTLPKHSNRKNDASSKSNLAKLSLPSISLQRQNCSSLSNDPAWHTRGQQESVNFPSSRSTRKASDL